MILTSYFSNWRKFPENMKTISVSRFPPKWAKFDEQMNELAPSSNLLMRYKNNEITDIEYTREYNEQLSNLNVNEIAEKIKGSVLLCFEKSGEFCHRNLIREWLKANGIDSSEL